MTCPPCIIRRVFDSSEFYSLLQNRQSAHSYKLKPVHLRNVSGASPHFKALTLWLERLEHDRVKQIITQDDKNAPCLELIFSVFRR